MNATEKQPPERFLPKLVLFPLTFLAVMLKVRTCRVTTNIVAFFFVLSKAMVTAASCSTTKLWETWACLIWKTCSWENRDFSSSYFSLLRMCNCNSSSGVSLFLLFFFRKIVSSVFSHNSLAVYWARWGWRNKILPSGGSDFRIGTETVTFFRRNLTVVVI